MKIKYNKIWLTKDKYIFRMSEGEHWYLKKFLILYKFFLSERRVIDDALLREISQIFQSYVDSIDHDEIKQKAAEYFFSPIDIRDRNDILNFEVFNNDENYDDGARKYYFVYLMGIGGQSGIKKVIKHLLYTPNITISEIIRRIPNIKKKIIEEDKAKGRRERYVNDSVNTIFSDFHGEIRNYRQLLSYRGILPPEQEGYEFNEIGELLCYSDNLLTMAIWEHQKIKMRYSNPYFRPIYPSDIENYRTYEDFLDFSVNPYIALLEKINIISNSNLESKFLNLEDYKYFICREAPFDLDLVFKKIKEFRECSKAQKKAIRNEFDNRPKSRGFSMDRPKTASEDFMKELKNFFYGIGEYRFTKKYSNYYNKPVEISTNTDIKIIDKSFFDLFMRFIKLIKNYLEVRYSKFYSRLAVNSSMNLVNIILEMYFEKSLSKKDHIKELLDIKEKLKGTMDEDFMELYPELLADWRWYISKIDENLLLYCYTYLWLMKNRGFSKEADFLGIDVHIPDLLEDIIGLKKGDILTILRELYITFYQKDDITKLPKIDYSNYDTINSSKIFEEDLQWLEKELVNRSYDEIKKILETQRKEKFLRYKNIDGKRVKVRDTKLMALVQKQRLNEHLVMDQKREDYEVNNCDACRTEFKASEPECHHIIPFEIDGPDNIYNYAFLCKNCHQIFTHRTKIKERPKLIKELKQRGIICLKHFENLIKQGALIPSHLDFLHKEGFIHIVHKLYLLKLIKTINIQAEKKYDIIKKTLNIFAKKVGTSAVRWNRAMLMTYFYRINNKYIMERYKSEYPIDKCDCCEKPFGKGEPECHHMIPKKINGPESPFNYLYLCKSCHDTFTYDRDNKPKLIQKLKKKELVSAETVYEMQLSDGLTEEHFKFLNQEKYVSAEEYNGLS